MCLEEKQMIGRIMDTDTMGYAYVYLGETDNREEYMVALTAENLANLIGGKGTDARQIIVTDVMDRLVINTRLGILDTCPDQRLCGESIRHLAPIQMGGEGGWGGTGGKPGCSRRIFSGRRTGGHYGRMLDAIE